MLSQITSYMMNLDPLVFYSIIALASLIILSKSADMLVYGISHYAHRLGVSDYLIGFIVVSIGTALPELVAALTAAAISQGAVVFGTIFGSNMFKIPLLGLVLLLAKKIKIKSNDLGTAPVITLIVISLPLLLVLDGYLSRVDGIILIAAFLLYISRLWHQEGQLGKMKKDVALKSIYKDSIIFIINLAVLLFSGRMLVFSSISISKIMGISPYIVGLFVIGIGASMPELTVQLRSVFRHHQNLAFGNVFGSLVANSALVLGITAVISPFSINISLLWVTFIMMVLGIITVSFLVEKEKLNWRHGLLLIGIFVLFILLELVF